MAQILLDANAEIDVTSEEGFTPLMLAARTGQSYSAWKNKPKMTMGISPFLNKRYIFKVLFLYCHFGFRFFFACCCFTLAMILLQLMRDFFVKMPPSSLQSKKHEKGWSSWIPENPEKHLEFAQFNNFCEFAAKVTSWQNFLKLVPTWSCKIRKARSKLQLYVDVPKLSNQIFMIGSK